MARVKSFFLAISLFFLCLSIYSQEKNDSLFTESEIILKTSTGDILGTLTVPNNVQTSPVVLIIAGSGPTDRDCNSGMGMKTNAYKMLAADFAKNGISTVRFDKRGVAKSKAAGTSESDLRFETYIQDVLSWIAFLKEDKRFSKIILLGHSEGSLIGIIAAEQGGLSGLISIAGAGRPADEILKDQLKSKLTMQMMVESNTILDSLKQGFTVSNVDPNLNVLYRPSVQPYLISWIKYDPVAEISKLKIPVLIIQGTTDIQIKVDDAKLLAAADPQSKLVIIDNMNHIMKESDSDMTKNLSTYWNPDLPLKQGLTEEIVSFINSLND
jgi:uncharacterized protein